MQSIATAGSKPSVCAIRFIVGYTMVGMALAKDLGIEVPEGLTGMQAAIQQAVLHNRVREQIVPLVDIRAPD